MKYLLLAMVLGTLLVGCQPATKQQGAMPATAANPDASLSIPYEKYQLDNGLTVILHQDKSDPIVALATIVHVGSNREKPGRTGFAHFFEHMAFNDSENVPQGANRRMVEELGGSRNGGTWSDGTMYYEVVPKDALEKLMWIDSDRLGFMINTVTEGALEREKQVVKNEKRQRVDNQAYGHTQHVILKNLYPEGHPYNWTVIGDLADLQAATLEDVKGFYEEYYGPGNATLVIAGDIDFTETKAMVARWFGEIAPGKEVQPLKPQPVTLAKSKSLYHLDSFAKLPELQMTFPTVEEYHPDSYALSALGEILSTGKRAPLYKELVVNQQLAPGASAYQSSQEIAGTFTLRVRANQGVDLDAVKAGIERALANFEQQGFSDTDLELIKARQETGFYNSISSVLNKAFQLGIYNEFAGDPGFISTDIARIKAVTKEDVMRVYRKYIKGQPYVMTSFVPKDQPELIVDGAVKANVVEEQVVADAEQEFDADAKATYAKTPTRHDRSEPPLGEAPLLSLPAIQAHRAGNGMEVLNIEQRELPLVNFSLRIDGGAMLESPDQYGVANVMAQLMNEGTASRTPEQLEDAIGLLGASIEVQAAENGLFITGNTLARHFDATMVLVTEILLQPRWEAAEFERIKRAQLTAITQRQTRPISVGMEAFTRLIYGTEHRGGMPTGGTMETVSALSLDDVKAFYARSISPQNATLHVVGQVSQQAILKASQPLIANWQGDTIPMPVLPAPNNFDQPKVFFIDIPDAKQSVIIMGKAALAGNDPDHYALTVAQNRLGGGGSARLFQTLRIEKGYTYGAYSQVGKRQYVSPFLAYAQVRANVTLESMEVFRELVSEYAQTFTEADLATTQNLLIKRNTRRFETLDSLLGMLGNISQYDLPHDYVSREQQTLTSMTVEQARALYRKYVNEQQMIYVVVGDAATQLERVKAFGYGEPIMLNRKGERL